MERDAVSGGVVDAAIKVHSLLGPGLLEHTYEVCLHKELEKRGMGVERQVSLPVTYDGERIDLGYRLDLLVEDQVIVEVKAVSTINEIHKAQLLSYLRLSRREVGLLLNFHVQRMRDGILRMINSHSKH